MILFSKTVSNERRSPHCVGWGHVGAGRISRCFLSVDPNIPDRSCGSRRIDRENLLAFQHCLARCPAVTGHVGRSHSIPRRQIFRRHGRCVDRRRYERWRVSYKRQYVLTASGDHAGPLLECSRGDAHPRPGRGVHAHGPFERRRWRDNGDLNLTPPLSAGQVIDIIGAGAASTIINANQTDRVITIDQGRMAKHHQRHDPQWIESGAGVTVVSSFAVVGYSLIQVSVSAMRPSAARGFSGQILTVVGGRCG